MDTLCCIAFFFLSVLYLLFYIAMLFGFFFVDVYHSSYVFIITTIDKRISPNVAGWLLRPERLRLKHQKGSCVESNDAISFTNTSY